MSWTNHPEMEPTDFPFHNFKPSPQKPWEWGKDNIYPIDEPEIPTPYEHYEDNIPSLWDKYI